MTYSIHTKISWEELVKESYEVSFYPSLAKKIVKSNDYFSSFFDIKITPLTTLAEEEAVSFFEIYEKEIASRGNYQYKKGEQQEILKKNMLEKSYLLFGVYLKATGNFVGGTIFSHRKDVFFTALRAFDSTLRGQYKSQTTIDFWVEKEFYEYARSQKTTRISHGTDNYPNIGRVGLPLFKLKIGGRPKISLKEHAIKDMSEEELLKMEQPVLFFDEADEKKHFQKCHLFYKDETIDQSVLGELTKVLEWKQIPLELHLQK